MDQNFDVTQFFSEQNLRYKICKDSPLDLVSQVALQSLSNNDKLRFGMRLRVNSLSFFNKKIKRFFRYSVSVYPIQFDSIPGFNWQIEHVYWISILKNRLLISGFMDHNILETGDRIVTEHQLALRIIDFLYIVTEYRHNGFFKSRQRGLGSGLEYKIIF